MPKIRNKVIHIRLDEPYNGARDYFFSSWAAIYEVLPKEVVGLAPSTIRVTMPGKTYYRTKTSEIFVFQFQLGSI